MRAQVQSGGGIGTWSAGPDGEPGQLVRECLQAAIAAPSIHNSQPWRFRVTPVGIDVFADRSRLLNATDPAGRELLISVGAAVFNLRVAMSARGRQPLLRLLPKGPNCDLVARVTPGAHVRPSETVRMLAGAIPRRHTSRGPFADVPVSPDIIAELVQAADAEGARLVRSGGADRKALFRVIRAAEVWLCRQPRYVRELAEWTFWQRGRRDGVPPIAFGPQSSPNGVPLRDFSLIFRGARRGAERFEASPTVTVLSTDADEPADWLHAGQALERVLLTATVRGLATSLMTQPTEVADLRELLRRDGAGWAQAVVRIGYGPSAAPSPRRPLEDVLILDPSVPRADDRVPATAGPWALPLAEPYSGG
jgi:nitroreductase